MSVPIFLSGRDVVRQAERLRRSHGREAAGAALAEAQAARARDNAVHYCRWRDVERLCALPEQRLGDEALH